MSTARPSAAGSPAASEAALHDEPSGPWRPIHWLALFGSLIGGAALRFALLPSQGFRGDIDQFVGWVHHIATLGLGTLYGETASGAVTFGPVMAYVWAALALVDGGFRTATDASDLGIRMLMKAPASIADLGLALLIAYGLRGRPRWAIAGATAVVLHPVAFDVSAWWGQYDSIYTLFGLAAVIAAINGRTGIAAGLVALALVTKPQALPFVMPLAAWFWAAGFARGGLRGGAIELVRCGAIGLGVAAVLWLPFIPAGGPLGYLQNLAHYQNDVYNVLSINAFNLWTLLQEFAAKGEFIVDDVAILGPLTLRHIGYVTTGTLELLIALAIIRRPTPRSLILGMAVSVLVFFEFMTQMHERYAFAAVAFLMLLITERGLALLGIAFGAAYTLNLMTAAPPTPTIESLLPNAGIIPIAGSIAMLIVTVLTWGKLTSKPAAPRAPEGVPAS